MAFRPLAIPEVFGLLALHLCTVAAYAVSRRRPERLHAPAEILVHAMLIVGIAMHALVAVQFGRWVVMGAVLFPLLMPCLAPALAVVFYAVELRARLRRRGLEAASAAWAERSDDAEYRANARREPPQLRAAVHGPTLLRALALSPVLLGLYALTQMVWLHSAAGALQVFTRTCGSPLSTLPIVVIQPQGHYLCTVAARGHTWLVRPERLGQRRGAAIVVNRQLAVANAFEDLIHERWPRTGALARRLYDRFGLPLSRVIRTRWMADVVYLAMKPLEWLFYLTLAIFDPGSPESRIARMYR
jgi:hypothetical protein